jgi:glyoxylase-like metal-dependent hydrolase (beta-lactamase superfamily II)
MGSGNITIHTYASPGMGSVNTHWIESPTGVVVIDGQRLTSQAQAVIDEIQKTGKPVEAVVITHIHPDHVGGTAAFVKAFPGARVAASAESAQGLKSDPGGLLALAKQYLSPDFEVATPTETLKDGEPFTAAGLTFEVRQVGPGESYAMNVLYLRDAGALFAADVVCNEMTPFLAEQRTGPWLKQLDWLAATYPDAQMVYPGHGAPAPLKTLVDSTRDYLTRVRELVSSHQTVQPQLTPALRTQIVGEIDQLFPGLTPVVAIPDALGLNVDGVWAEVLREKQPAPGDSWAWKFYEKHLQFFYTKDVEGLLASDYADDCQLVSYDFAVRGHEAMRPIFTQYLNFLGDFTVKSTEHFTYTDDSLMLEATLVGPKFGERKVYDVFVFRGGKAIFHFTGTR